MSVEGRAEEYFRNLNAIASRMCRDMNDTKQAYDKLWSTLSEKEKEQILNETIIKPEISLQYGLNKPKQNRNEYGVKMVIDDNCTFRDEHSAPFSFRTASQRDLSLFDKKDINFQLFDLKEVGTFGASELIEEVSSNNNIPKTGLDLLDNW